MAIVFTSCDKEREMRSISFNATMERIGDDGSKVLLSHERWTVWEVGDQIDIASDLSEGKAQGDLVNSSAGTDWEDYNGVFIATLPWESKYFLGLFPKNEGNVITSHSDDSDFSPVKINLNRKQPLRCDTSFARNVFPMVAWFGGDIESELGNLDFHSLGCIIRLQLFTTDGNTHVIDSINITSDGKQLCGLFDVTGYKTAEPYLIPTDNTKNNTITLSCGNNSTLATMSSGTLHTFYVVLPATNTRSVSVNHSMTVEVYDTNHKYCKKSFTANVRRNGITYLPALNITGWATAPAEGSATRGLVGNGTESRPFKIYNINDLDLVRTAFSTTPVIINNQTVTANTHFRIMTSTIELTNENWTAGISNFCGKMSYSGANPSAPAITNNSTAPLFDNISAEGEVSGLQMQRGTQAFAASGNWSPFCYTNRGTIRNCRIVSTTGGAIKNSSDNSVAGICFDNYGEISGCGCEASFTTNGPFAGICYNNRGTIRECYISSPATIAGATDAAGICYNNTNSGNIYDSYYAMSVTGGATNWGGIAYNNNGRVEHCYASSTGNLITTGTAGGIVNSQAAGIINYCFSSMNVGGSTVGAIAATVSGGTVINSFMHNSLSIISINGSTNIGGGLVGTMSGGIVRNCYAYFNRMRNENGGTSGGFIGEYSGGTLNNCYVYETSTEVRSFYGSATSTSNISACYLAGASQVGVSNIATNDMSTLLSKLNDSELSGISYGTSGDNPRSWVSNGGIPSLTPYSGSKKRKK